MQTFLVSYDLDRPGQDYPRVIDRLENLGALRVLYSVWLLRTKNSVKDIRDDLKQYAGANDRLMVAVLAGEAAWTKVMVSNEQFKEALNR